MHWGSFIAGLAIGGAGVAGAAVVSTVVSETVRKALQRLWPDGPTDVRLVPTPPPAVDWTLNRIDESTYELRNIGAQTATGVCVDAHGYPVTRNLPSGATIPAGEAVSFMLIQMAEEPMPLDVRVTWDGCTGPKVLPVR